MSSPGRVSPTCRFPAIRKKLPFVPDSLLQPVSTFTFRPISSAAVPFLYCAVMCKVTFFPETCVTSIFIQSVLLASDMAKAPTACMPSYFTHCPVETPGLWSAARIGATDAKNTVRANATAILILRFCMFSYLLRILAALLFLTVSA